jgi:hypothetical protein
VTGGRMYDLYDMVMYIIGRGRKVGRHLVA